MPRAIAIAAALAMSPSAPTAIAQTITFADAPPDTLPAEFESARTGRGAAAEWKVVADPSAAGGKALAQLSADRTDYRFPLAIYTPLVARNVEVAVRCKPVAGRVDQACGVAVRLQSPDDYYIARANALEHNVRFYRVVRGRREELKSAGLRVSANEWHTLALRAEGERFTVSFDDQTLFAVTDATFAGAGRIALWTKADSVTHFDRIEIRPIP